MCRVLPVEFPRLPVDGLKGLAPALMFDIRLGRSAATGGNRVLDVGPLGYASDLGVCDAGTRAADTPPTPCAHARD